MLIPEQITTTYLLSLTLPNKMTTGEVNRLLAATVDRMDALRKVIARLSVSGNDADIKTKADNQDDLEGLKRLHSKLMERRNVRTVSV